MPLNTIKWIFSSWIIERLEEIDTDRQTYIHTETDMHTYRDRQTDRQRQTDIHTYRDRHAYRHVYIQRQTNIQTETDRQTDKDRQTETEMEERDIFKIICMLSYLPLKRQILFLFCQSLWKVLNKMIEDSKWKQIAEEKWTNRYINK